ASQFHVFRARHVLRANELYRRGAGGGRYCAQAESAVPSRRVRLALSRGKGSGEGARRPSQDRLRISGAYSLSARMRAQFALDFSTRLGSLRKSSGPADLPNKYNLPSMMIQYCGSGVTTSPLVSAAAQ